jgi:p-hydroxybenzoate 3-monooxygenase
VIEPGTAALLDEAGVGAQMRHDGLRHAGIELVFDGRRHRIDFHELLGQDVVIYGQTEITRDLMAGRAAVGGHTVYEAANVRLEQRAERECTVHYQSGGVIQKIECEYIAGCDGSHGISRMSFPAGSLRQYERVYPFGWLGIMVDQPPVAEELIYVHHERGFALCSMRSATRSRLYLQCPVDDRIEDWPDSRFYAELRQRLDAQSAAHLRQGPSIEKSIAPLRSFVSEPMRHGNLFLAGDAAHIVPPTGAKGLNLAASDVYYLWQAFLDYYRGQSARSLDRYSDRALHRIWKAERFSWWMTSLLHRFPESSDFDNQMQLAELEYLVSSRAAMSSLAENYVGLPY